MLIQTLHLPFSTENNLLDKLEKPKDCQEIISCFSRTLKFFAQFLQRGKQVVIQPRCPGYSDKIR